MSGPLYQLTPNEMRIIQKAQEEDNPNIFLDWFLKGPATGTYYKPYAITEIWKSRYQALFDYWIKLDRPRRFKKPTASGEIREYAVRFKKGVALPTFFYHHGHRLLKWQLELWRNRRNINVVISGYGAGKTAGVTSLQLYCLATIPGYRVAFTAPSSNQAMEAHKLARNMMTQTLYGKKFLRGKTNKPPAMMTFGNSLVGEDNTLEIYSIGDDVSKIETFNLHAAVIDQAEKFDNLDEVKRVIGSRFRGQIQGYEIEGNMFFLANASDNEALWDMYDEAEEDPGHVYADNPTTYDNIHITDEQLVNIEKDVGGTEESINTYMKGLRPLGSGEHFPRSLLEKIRAPVLDDIMNRGLEAIVVESMKEDGTVETKRFPAPGYIKDVRPKIGVVRWAIPYIKGHDYLVMADPGADNPPRRNSAVIMVWDYTKFPKRPASLAEFNWVYGYNSSEPWMAAYHDSVSRYHAKLSAGVDSTGWQAGIPDALWSMDQALVTGMNLNIQSKAKYLTFTKRMCERGLFQLPPSINGVFSQLSRYVLPDLKIKQDIVMCFIMSGGWLAHLLNFNLSDPIEADDDLDDDDDRLPRRDPRYDLENPESRFIPVEERW